MMPRSADSKDLRRQAEQRLDVESTRLEAISDADVKTLIHELRVHQVELEMQNEQLRQDQIELEASRSQYADLFDFAPIGYFVLDTMGHIVQLNLTAAAMLRRDRRDLKGKPFNVLLEAADRDAFRTHRLLAMETGAPQECQVGLLRPDNRETIVRLRSRSVEKRSGDRPIRYCRTAAIDMTRQTEAEQALREQAERLRLAMEGGQLGMWDDDLLTERIHWDRHLYELLGRDPQGPAITGETFFEYIHEDDRPRVRKHLEQCCASRQPDFSDEFRIVRDDGQTCWLASSGRIYRDGAGRPVRLCGVNYDITARKEAQQALREAHDGLKAQVQDRTAELSQTVTTLQEEVRQRIEAERQLAELNEELLLTEERERRRIATALHDGIGQYLALSKRELGVLRKDTPESLLEKLDRVRMRLDEAIGQTRSLTFELSPATLYTFGLEAAIEELTEQFSQQEGFTCHLEAQDGEQPLAEPIKVLLYRAVRELLMNVAKHAAAKSAFIRVQYVGDRIRVEVEDDGCGFDASTLDSDQGQRVSFGLFSLRERLTRIGGSFQIESVVGDGTRVVMEAPL